MHQQPPHTPLCFSTSRAKSDQVFDVSGFTVYFFTVVPSDDAEAAERPRDEPPGQRLERILDPIRGSWPGRLHRVVRRSGELSLELRGAVSALGCLEVDCRKAMGTLLGCWRRSLFPRQAFQALDRSHDQENHGSDDEEVDDGVDEGSIVDG